MKKISLKYYSINQLKKFNQDHSLKIKTMLKDVENNNHRLLAPLATFIYLSNKTNLNTGEYLGSVTKDMFKKYPVITEENALLFLNDSKIEDLNAFAKSFKAENARRDENEFKDRIRKSIQIMQKQKNFSNYEICKRANIDVGNFHSFYVLNKNNKLSVKKLLEISDVCYKM